jgi:hypothetical protein
MLFPKIQLHLHCAPMKNGNDEVGTRRNQGEARQFSGRTELAAPSAHLANSHFSVIILLTVFALLSGCSSPDTDATLFHSMGCEDAKDAKSHLDPYANILAISINEDHWEDRGPRQKSVYHVAGTVANSFKGDWAVSDRLAFAHYVDTIAPAKWKTETGGLMFVFTNEHTSAEIVLDTFEWGWHTPEMEQIFQKLYPPGARR